MAIRLEPATEELEQGVTALFARMGLPVEPDRWLRAYSPDAPPDYASTPYAALDEDEQVVGFMALRPIELYIDRGFEAAIVIHDMIADPEQEPERVIHAMALEAADHGVVALLAGAPIDLAPLLERERFEFGAYFQRYLFQPAQTPPDINLPTLPYDLATIGEFPPALEELNHALVSERRVFRLRRPADLTWHFNGPYRDFEILASRDNSPLDAYVVLSEVPGRHGPELHVEDFAAPIAEAGRLVLALQQLARKRERNLYWSLLCPQWAKLLRDYGFDRLRPRWPLHWMIGDPLEKEAGRILVRNDVWFQTPADLSLDRI